MSPLKNILEQDVITRDAESYYEIAYNKQRNLCTSLLIKSKSGQ